MLRVTRGIDYVAADGKRERKRGKQKRLKGRTNY